MKKILLVLLLVVSLFTLVSCTDDGDDTEHVPPSFDTSEENTVHLVILAGQSGARGKALVSDLKDKSENTDVDIVVDGCPMDALKEIPAAPFEEEYQGILTSEYPDVLKPGYGDFGSEFGPELGIGETLASRYQKGDMEYKSVIVKYTGSGSTFISDWYSKSAVEDKELYEQLDDSQIRELEDGSFTGPLTHNLYQLIDHTKAYLADFGYNVVVDGAAFVHGEQDAKFDENMAIYEKALEYFIKDLRDYVGNSDLPFVVTEALTNSADYSNELRAIQNRVATKMNNVSFVMASDLYTNTFEPWHFGAESNNVLGNRIAAEIISHNDNRVIESIDEEVINVPKGVNVNLPRFVKATFDNGYSGYVKVNQYISSYDSSKLGEQDVKFNVKTIEGLVEKSLKVNVSDKVAYVDGVLNEYASAKANALPNNLGNVYVIKGDKGLYIAADIKDSHVWTNGEKWHEGDLGQSGQNDDFRVYVTTSSAENRKTLCLSAANLLRVYNTGISLDDTPSNLLKNNLVYSKGVTEYQYHVTTTGLVNREAVTVNGLVLELYISYADLGITNPADIKLCFNYNNVSVNDGTYSNVDNYLASDNNAKPEEDINSYISILDLI